jgi:ribosome recycling factor
MADIAELRRRMEGAIKTLQTEFSGLRTGRASANLLDPIQVDAYGSMMPLNQVASVSVPEPRMITVQVWDKSMVKSVEKAIRDANLGLNPGSDGQLVRVPIPQLSEDRRKELQKIAGKYTEAARVAIRNIRRDGNDFLKKQEKDNVISKDEHEKKAGDVQKLTDEFIKKVDDMLTAKEKDIMQV